MDPSDAIQLATLILLLMLSAFFSSAETSLTTANKIRMKSLADEGNKRAQTYLTIIDDSGKMLSAILIGNNLVNISASAITSTLTMRLFGSAAVSIATGILTLLVLIFGEITPKTLATIYAERLALFFAGPIHFLMKLLTPVIFIINKLSFLFLRLLRVDPNASGSTMTEKELRTIVDVSHEEGVIESEERQMIYNVFDFGDSQARDIMVPRWIWYRSACMTHMKRLQRYSNGKNSPASRSTKKTGTISWAFSILRTFCSATTVLIFTWSSLCTSLISPTNLSAPLN